MRLQDFDRTGILIDVQNHMFRDELEELIFTHLGTKGEDYWSLLYLFNIQSNDSLYHAWMGETRGNDALLAELRAGTHVFLRDDGVGINDVLTILNEKGLIDDCDQELSFEVWW